MEDRAKGLSLLQKFTAFLCCIFFLAAFDSWFFVFQSKEIEFYDDLDYRINDLKFSMIKLEYVLDMFVVARHFEQEKVKLIAEDVQKVDRNMRELEALGYNKFAKNAPVSDAIKFLAEDWDLIKSDFSRLSDALSNDVVLLIHNSADMNMFLFAEKVDKLLGDINKTRKGVFKEIKVMVVGTLLVSLFLAALASLIFIRKTFTPIKRIALEAKRVVEEDPDFESEATYKDEAKMIASAMDIFKEAVSRSRAITENESVGLTGDIEAKRKQIEMLTAIAERAGESLSQTDLFNVALGDTVISCGADAAGVYLKGEEEREGLKLMASTGFAIGIRDEISHIPYGDRYHDRGGAGRDISIKELEEFPGGIINAALMSEGFTSVIAVSIPYNYTDIGRLLLFFKDKATCTEDTGQFLHAVASLVGAVAGHMNLYYDEHYRKNFLESIVEQSPLGLAVFDRDGAALMINATLKRMLGVSSDDDFIRRYNLFEDNIFDSESVFPIFREAYEGFTSETELEYNPSRLTWYEFDGLPMRLRLKSFPLYDAGGEITRIALLYEDVSIPTEELRSTVGEEEF